MLIVNLSASMSWRHVLPIAIDFRWIGKRQPPLTFSFSITSNVLLWLIFSSCYAGCFSLEMPTRHGATLVNEWVDVCRCFAAFSMLINWACLIGFDSGA